jgi:ketosteroid isomerase-like protein
MTSDGHAALSGEGDGQGASDRLAHDEVVRLEVRGWEALSAGAEEATAFYRDVLDDDVVMLLPGGLTLRGAEAVLPTLGQAPWRGFAIADAEVRHPVPDLALLTYAVSAHRDGPSYDALITTVYARRPEGWRMVLHQHTPDAS